MISNNFSPLLPASNRFQTKRCEKPALRNEGLCRCVALVICKSRKWPANGLGRLSVKLCVSAPLRLSKCELDRAIAPPQTSDYGSLITDYSSPTPVGSTQRSSASSPHPSKSAPAIDDIH